MIPSTLTNLPDPFASKKTKDTKEYGIAMANYILGATQEYREKRNRRFSKNRALAEGKQDLQPVLKMAGFSEENLFTNLVVKPSSLAKKFENIVVDGYMESKKEYFKAIALSSTIKQKKQDKKNEAEFRMNYGDVISQLTQESGVQLEDPNAFTPESKEHSDIYFALNEQEKEETLYNEMMSFVANDIDLEDLKRKMLSELYQLNLFGLYEYIDQSGRQRVDFIQGEDTIYSQSYRDDFKDIWYAGRFIRMTVGKLRSLFAIKDEKSFFQAIQSSAAQHSDGCWTGTWKEDFREANERPYDGNVVVLKHIWSRLSKGMEILEGKDRNNRDIFDWSYEYGELQGTKDGRKKVQRKYPETAYEGYFLGDKNFCLEWKEQERIVKEDFDKGLILCPFIFFMCGNNGRMDTQSQLESISDYIQNIDLASIKIKQIIATSPPPGNFIDVNGLAEMDLGTGMLKPLELMSIYRQTGDLYWKSKKEEGTEVASPPVRPIQSNLDFLMSPFINMYNLNLSMIRDTLGVNEFRDGSVNPSRVGFRLAQSQIAASNTATLSVYRGFSKSAEKLAKQMGIRIWHALKWGDENKGYLLYLGKENVDYIKNRENIVESTYDFKVMLALTAEDAEKLESNIQICLQAGTLYPEDVIVIRRTAESGLDLAEKYLSYMSDRRRRERVKEAQDNAAMSAESTARAGAEVEKVKQETIKLDADVTLLKEKEKGNQERNKNMESLVWDLIRKQQEGFPIPEPYLPLVQSVLNNLGLNISMETVDKEAQAQQLENEQIALEQEQALQDLQSQLTQEVEEGILTQEEAQVEYENAVAELQNPQSETNISEEEAIQMMEQQPY